MYTSHKNFYTTINCTLNIKQYTIYKTVLNCTLNIKQYTIYKAVFTLNTSYQAINCTFYIKLQCTLINRSTLNFVVTLRWR